MGCCISKGPDKYEDYDWVELPIAVREAAQTLGYTKKKWDKGKDPDIVEECDWDDLTDEQKKAAAVLGYDEETWDKEE